MRSIDIALTFSVAMDIPFMVFLGFIAVKYGAIDLRPTILGKLIYPNLWWFSALLPVLIGILVTHKLWFSFSLPLITIIPCAISIVVIGWTANLLVWAFSSLIIHERLEIPIF